MKANFEAALDALSDVAEIEEVSLPDLPYVEVTRTILMVESASAFEDFLSDGGPQGLTAPEDHYAPYARTAILATDYVRALRLRGVIARQIDGVMSGFDAFAAPTSPTVATPIDEQFPARGPPAPATSWAPSATGAACPRSRSRAGSTATVCPRVSSSCRAPTTRTSASRSAERIRNRPTGTRGIRRTWCRRYVAAGKFPISEV